MTTLASAVPERARYMVSPELQQRLLEPTHAVGSRCGSVFSGVCLSVRLSVFFRTMSGKPTQLGSSNATQKCSMSMETPFILGSKSQRSRSRSRGTKTCVVGLQTECHIAAYVNDAGFSQLRCPAAQAMLATAGLPGVMRDRQTTGVFPVCVCIYFFAVSQRQNTVGVGHDTIVSAGFV